MRSGFRWIVAGAGVLLGSWSLAPASAIDLKPKVFPLSMLGVTVSVPVTISFQAISEGDALALRVTAVGNFKDVQDKALNIARKLPLPRGNCDRKGLNVVVDSIDDAKITPDGNTAIVELAGHVKVWGCVDVFGGDVKTIVASDSVQVTVPVELLVTGGKEIRLKLSRPAELKTGHALTAEATRVFVGDLNAKLSSALAGVLDAHEARATLPDLPGADFVIESAEFAADGTVLTVQAKGGGKLTSETFSRALEFLSK